MRAVQIAGAEQTEVKDSRATAGVHLRAVHMLYMHSAWELQHAVEIDEEYCKATNNYLKVLPTRFALCGVDVDCTP